jgi:hypothetical protein
MVPEANDVLIRLMQLRQVKSHLLVNRPDPSISQDEHVALLRNIESELRHQHELLLTHARTIVSLLPPNEKNEKNEKLQPKRSMARRRDG